MREREIDLERVVSDPVYRRRIIDYLNGRTPRRESDADKLSRTIEAAPRSVAAGN